MKKIYLFCSAGMSTSMLANIMQGVANEHKLPLEIKAFPDGKIDEVVEENVQRPVTEGNVDNPNTGDKGVLSYLLIAMASAIGLVKNRKGKKE